MNRAWLSRTLVPSLIHAGILGSILFAAAAAPSQTVSTLPPTAPTSLANPNSLPAPIAGMPTSGNPLQHHRARVNYVNGLLDVRADNSSLNQILRDISRKTGMTIIGGVADQRIFGNYGPAAPATVLQTLLDGTNTNMLLRETASGGPAQLLLTPRSGGATPPSPNSTSYDATENEPEMSVPGQQPAEPVASSIPGAVAPSANPRTSSPVMPTPQNNVLGSPSNVSPTASTLPTVQSVPTESLPTPSTAQAPSGIVSAPNPPPAYSTTAGYTSQTPASSNPNNSTSGSTSTTSPAVKTPQQIFEELQQLQKKQSTQSTQGSSTPQQ